MTSDSGLSFHGTVDCPAFSLDVEVAAASAEVVAVLGPNGSGKSTLLAAIAGLEPLNRGRCTLNGRVLADADRNLHLPAYERRIGFVFQDYRLFPHLSVLDNVSFAARVGGASRTVARASSTELLKRLDLIKLSTRRPTELSGGERQRVAVARALAAEPELLLLDEPMSALDVRTRAAVQAELAQRIRDFPGPVLLVTHDPLEAMSLANRILILEDGRVVQAGAPREIAARPRTDYVARLVGLNLFRGSRNGDSIDLPGGGRIIALPGPAGDVLAAIRPASIVIALDEPSSSARNAWRMTVRSIATLGDRVRLDLSGEVDLLADVTMESFAEFALHPGLTVWASVKATEVDVY